MGHFQKFKGFSGFIGSNELQLGFLGVLNSLQIIFRSLKLEEMQLCLDYRHQQISHIAGEKEFSQQLLSELSVFYGAHTGSERDRSVSIWRILQNQVAAMEG